MEIIKKLIMLGIVAGLVGTLALAMALPASAAPDTIVRVSDTGTLCAGYTTTNPVGAPNSLDPSNYDYYNANGVWKNAVALDTTGLVPAWWYDNSLLPPAPAVWVSSADPREGDQDSYKDDQWRLFKEEFTIPAGSINISGSVHFTADNAVAVYLNGVLVDTTPEGPAGYEDLVYGDSPYGAFDPQYFSQLFEANITPQEGPNTLMFVVRNWGWPSGGNPTGLLYRAEIEYDPLAGPTEVGGEVFPINLDTPTGSALWLGLALVLAAGGGIFVIKRRRAN